MKIECPSDDRWFFTAVYANLGEQNKRLLWDDLHSISVSAIGNWLAAGDLNDILGRHENKGDP